MSKVFELQDRLELIKRKIKGYTADLNHASMPCMLSGYRDNDQISYLKNLISDAEKEIQWLENALKSPEGLV